MFKLVCPYSKVCRVVVCVWLGTLCLYAGWLHAAPPSSPESKPLTSPGQPKTGETPSSSQKTKNAQPITSNKRKKTKKPQTSPVFESVTVGQRVREDAFRTPRTITVLNKQRLEEKRPRTVPEALMEEAGIFVQKTNHAGGAPYIRGTVGPQILILVDGIRLNNSTYRSGPNQYLNLIDPNYLERLEVLRGPGSIAYGSYAFGGVISAETPDTPMTGGSRFRYQGALLGRYGSADQELSTHAHFGGSVSNFGFQGSVSYGHFSDVLGGGTLFTPDINANGKFVTLDTGTLGPLIVRGQSGRQAFSGYQHFFADGKTRVRIHQNWELQLAYQRAQHFHAGRTDQLESRQRVRYYDNIRDLVYFRTLGKFPHINTDMSLTLSYHRQDEVVTQDTLDKTTYARTQQSITHDETHTVGLNWGGKTRIKPWFRLSYGLDFYGDIVSSDARSKNEGQDFKPATANFPAGSSYFTLGAYVLGRFQLWSWKPKSGLYLHVGERINGFFAAAAARDIIDAVSFQQIGHAPYASFQAIISPHFNVSLSYAEGFRAPNLQEAASLGDQGNFYEVANPNLAPEISRTLELSVRGRIPDHFELWATSYVSFWNNLIDRDPTTYKGQSQINGKNVVQPVNKANARVLGVETGLRWRIWQGLSLAGNLTWALGREIAADGKELFLSRMPPLFGKISLAYRFQRRGFIEVFVVASDKQAELSERDKLDPRIPNTGTPGWWTLNLRGGAQITDFARLIVSVENLLDVQYKYHGSGILGPGLHGRVTLELAL